MKAITPEQMTTLINSSYNKIPIVNKNSPGIILPPPNPLSEWVKTLEIRNSNDPEIHSDFYDWTIHSSITLLEDENNPEDGFFVRMRAYSWLDSQYESDHNTIQLSYSDDAGLWSFGEDGWYYYSEPLLPGCSTQTMNIEIYDNNQDDFRWDYPPYTDTNNYIIKIAIFYEIAIIFHDEGEQIYPDWSLSEALRPPEFAIPEYVKMDEDYANEVLDEKRYPIKNIYRFSNCEFYDITLINESDSGVEPDWEITNSYFGGEEGFKYGLARISFNDFNYSGGGGAE